MRSYQLLGPLSRANDLMKHVDTYLLTDLLSKGRPTDHRFQCLLHGQQLAQVDSCSMSSPPPYTVGATKFWATAPSGSSLQSKFPVSTELYIAVRDLLHTLAQMNRDVREYEARTGRIRYNVLGQTITDVLSLSLPHLLAIYIAMNNGTIPKRFIKSS